VTGLLAVLLLLSADAGLPGTPDGGMGLAPATRSAEDEEVIRNLELLERLADSEALQMVIELSAERATPAR
jgi:hypothetical protein